MTKPRWRVAITHDEDNDGPVQGSLEREGFISVACPVMIEGPAHDRERLMAVAGDLERYDWVICSSVRGVRALVAARQSSVALAKEGGSQWPSRCRAAAVGAVTARAMVAAGAREPIHANTFSASALWTKLHRLDSWHCRQVLVVTVAGGRRDLIEGLTAAGASVTELEAYTMTPRTPDDIRKDWDDARPDAVILGSAATATTLIEAIGVEPIRRLRSVVPIGPTTAAALADFGLAADPPQEATFAAVIERLVTLRDRAGIG